MFNLFIIKYNIAFILDLILGDPHFFYHPVQFIGLIIEKLEKLFYHFKNKLIFGSLVALMTVIITFTLSYFLSLNKYLEIFFLYTTLATTSLAREGLKVYKILKLGDLEKAKQELSYLVSRDTKNLPEEKIIMSVVETISENTVDGVIAPMFYAFIGSFFYINNINLALCFAMTYKAVNTLDSMLGYKNEKYILFGRFSAKMDDFFNFIPARLTACILVPFSSLILNYNFKNSVKVFFRDRNKHASPNSGQVEAAYAGALNIQFGGSISYFGKNYEKPKIGEKLKDFDIEDIKKSINILYLVSFIGMVIINGLTWWKYI